MADTRYKEYGYSTTFMEDEHGASITISRNGEIVAEVSVGMVVKKGPDPQVGVAVKRFKRNELRDMSVTDDFDGSDEE